MALATSHSSQSRKLSLNYNSVLIASALAVIYVILLFTLPIGRESVGAYQPSILEYRILRFAIILPSILVWLAAFMGYGTLKRYAELVSNTPEGTSYQRLADGCKWLAWSLPITALISLIVSTIYYEKHTFHAAAIIITNYTELLLPLVAFSLIGSASRKLLDTAGLKFRLISARLIVLIFMLAGIAYCYATFTHFDLSNVTSTNNPYFLPIWLMILTVTVPYLYLWFIGLLSCYEIALFSQKTSGWLYKRALRFLVVGLTTIIVSSIALQYINGVYPRTGHLIMDRRLIIAVFFRILSGVGYIILTIGALRLKKIEEV